MADRTWTPAQEEAIRARGSNILVSAAAGSGKTAVLVERVIRRITDPEAPSDLDRFLIMTFTRAAAAEMRARIFDAIRERLRSQPENRFLRQQMMKVQTARICTIDSLCAEIVRDHIQDIDLDPGYRLADEAEIRMLQSDTLKELLEEQYQEGREDFLEFAEYYVDKNDARLEDILLRLYRYAQSHPEPEPWLRALEYPYLQAQTLYGEEETPEDPSLIANWMEVYAGIVEESLERIAQMAEQGLRIAEQNFGPAPYAALFGTVLEQIRQMEGKPFDYRAEALEILLSEYPKTPPLRNSDPDVDPALKDAAMELNKEIKKQLSDLKEQYLYDDLETIFGQMGKCRTVVRTIADLVLRFDQRLTLVKKNRKIADFSDIAHYALRILLRYDDSGRILRDETGAPCCTEAAQEMAGSLEEIIVDEYQDTNYLQEYLVQALSGERFGRPNLFMVGDVKQSIYRFRLACPELFQEKYASYVRKEEGKPFLPGRLIILDRNFRSRKEILDAANLVFSRIMTGTSGNIDYSSGHQLVYGGLFGDTKEPDPEYLPEILMIQGSSEQEKYLEAYRIASRIEELVSEGTYRFSDMAILTQRSDNPQLEEVLRQRGIPVLKTSRSGFFDSFEIRLVLDLLRIIDNPYQDIPFTSVLYSPVCSASSEDLARIRIAGQGTGSMYECLKAYCGENPEGGERFRWFLEKLELWRGKATYTGLYDLIEEILEDSGLWMILTAMPEGGSRKANLEFLKSRAQAFAKGSYIGLFQFIRYIKALQETGIDFGNAAGEKAAEAVRMMTMHRSKGLEFPVVFLACCGKEYNEEDLRFNVIADRQLGLGIEYRDPESRRIRRTVLMQTIRQKQKNENRAEEMRLLYVAMTRAKEKLIITGTDRFLNSRIKKWEKDIPGMSDAMSAKSHLSLLGLSLYAGRDHTAQYRLDCVDAPELEQERAEEVADHMELRERLLAWAAEPEETNEAELQCGYQYPFERASVTAGKRTASALENREVAQRYRILPPEKRIYTEEETQQLIGAERGNAYHRFLELLEYDRPFEQQLEEFAENGKLRPEYAQSIDPEKIRGFLKSPVGQRMRDAFLEGRLYREQQFVMGDYEDVNAPGSGVPDEELILTQGIIDAWFTETKEDQIPRIILVDYKTDRIRDEEYYRLTYAPQLAAYAKALERSSGYKVAEQIIYSFELEQEICLTREKEL